MHFFTYLVKGIAIWLYYVKGSETGIEIAERFRKNGIEVMGAGAARCSDNDLLQSYPVTGLSRKPSNVILG